MKKIFKFSLLAGTLGLLGVSLVGVHANRSTLKPTRALDAETSIEMTSAFFTNWAAARAAYGDKDPGNFRSAGATYWGGSFNAFGSFFDGCTDGVEEWKGTLNSRKWLQNTQWISFEWGCAQDHIREGDSVVKLVFHIYTNEEDTTPYASYDVFNDTFMKVSMVQRNFRVPDEVMTHFGNNPFYMSVDLVDGRENQYGAHVFGNLKVNQTQQQVADAEWHYYKNCAVAEEQPLSAFRQNYYLNGTLRQAFTTSFAENFDTQESFDANFMRDDYGSITDGKVAHPDRAISQSTYRTGTNMPFNNTNGFFKGWYGGANDDYDGHVYGFVDNDSSTYRFVSKPFRLPENGLVSVKMAGGGASLHLVDFDGGHGDLAWVDCKTFVEGGDESPIAKTGKNTVTMVNHIVNFSKYAGRLVQIGIADVNKPVGWTAAYFDELRADYSVTPAIKVDVVPQTVSDVTSYSAFNDVYVTSVEGNGGVDYANNDGPESDSSPLLPASNFVKDYMNLFRNNHETDRFCNVYQSQDAIDLVNAYVGLGEAAQKIVCASNDYHRVNATIDNWHLVRPTFDLEEGSAEDRYLGYSIGYLAKVNNISNVTVYDAGGLEMSVNINRLANSIDTNVLIIVIAIVSVTSISAFILFTVIKKRKEQR